MPIADILYLTAFNCIKLKHSKPKCCQQKESSGAFGQFAQAWAVKVSLVFC